MTAARSTERALLAVLPHPDDETFAVGGTLARYAAAGVRTVLVICTGGEVGEISDPALATPETLGVVRAGELAASARALGIARSVTLGYRDSGMAGTPDNDHPASFNQASLDEATGKLVAIVRQERPDVLVTYDDNGFYGHPDHIKAHQITVAAFDAAADPATRAIPVVAVSADGNRGAALACGCDDFLAKPFDLDAIERVVRRWLA